MARQTPRKQELIARITELRGEGKSWDVVTDIITRDGFVDASGEEYKTASLAAGYSKSIKAKPSMTLEPESGPTADTVPVPASESETGLTDSEALSGMTLESETSPMSEPEPVFTESEKLEDATTNGMTLDAESGMTDMGEAGPTREAETSLTSEMQALITEFMEQEVRRIMTGITVEEIQKSGRGGTAQAVKKSFSIPLDVWTEFEGRFRGSILSNHVAAALKMYLNLKPA